MQQIFQLIIGLCVLALGIPIGDFLAKETKEELKPGRKWFSLIVLLSLAGGIFGLITENDSLLFTMFFISIVTSRSIKKISS